MVLLFLSYTSILYEELPSQNPVNLFYVVLTSPHLPRFHGRDVGDGNKAINWTELCALLSGVHRIFGVRVSKHTGQS